MSKKEISMDDLGNVVGGFSGITAWNGNGIRVTQDEYNELQKGGFIVDGKIKNGQIVDAGNYLKNNGFDGRIYSTGHIPLGVVPVSADSWANITIIDKNNTKVNS